MLCEGIDAGMLVEHSDKIDTLFRDSQLGNRRKVFDYSPVDDGSSLLRIGSRSIQILPTKATGDNCLGRHVEKPQIWYRFLP